MLVELWRFKPDGRNKTPYGEYQFLTGYTGGGVGMYIHLTFEEVEERIQKSRGKGFLHDDGEFLILIGEVDDDFFEQVNDTHEPPILNPPPEPDWDKYRDCNSHTFASVNYKRGGGFAVAKYIGKPLSRELWNMLVEVVKPNRLWIIKHGEAVWCIDHGGVQITVNDKDEVVDFDFSGAMFKNA